MQTLTRIKSLLAERGLSPKKRFGQNFLHERNQIRRILDAAGVQPGDRVLEVGPGTGTLSVALLEAGATLIAVEIDRDLEPILRQVFEPYHGRATLLMTDVLADRHRLAPPVQSAIRDSPSTILIANLPYNVASPLLVNIATREPTITRAIVMVQKEVADRLAASPGSKDYGPLGILVQAACMVERMFTLAPSCFWPAPQIDSAVVRLVRRPSPLTDDLTAFGDLVHRLFQQRRKQIGTILGRDTPLPPGVRPDLRPEQLKLEQLAALAAMLRSVE